MNKKILILVDSSTTLDQETARENGIEILPLSIYRDDDKLFTYEALKLSNDDFLKMSESGHTFKTSCTPIGLIEEIIEEKLKEYDDIIALPISRKWSSQYDHLVSVANDKRFQNHIHVVDTLEFGFAIEKLALNLREMINKDIYTLDELLKYAHDYHNRSVSFFFCRSLDGLVNSGRVPKIIGKLMKLTKVYPIIRVEGENHLEAIIKNLAEVANRIIKGIHKCFGDKLSPSEIEQISILTACNSDLYINEFRNDLAKALNLSVDKIEIRNSPNIFINIVSRNAIGVSIVTNRNKKD